MTPARPLERASDSDWGTRGWPAVPARIMIVEDQELLRFGLELILGRSEDCLVVASVANGEDALARYDELEPDLVLLDLTLGSGMTGTQVCRSLVERDPAARILLVTAESSLDRLLEAVQAGASGYLPKDVGPKDLLEAIRKVMRGEDMLEPYLGRLLLREMRRTHGLPAPRPATPKLTLSARELEILSLVARGRSNAEIADVLCISGFTVANHLKNVYRKLGVKDRTQAVLTAVQMGLVDGNSR